MFDAAAKADDMSDAIDEIYDFYGNFTIFTAHTLTETKSVKQKIPFGGTEYFELLLSRLSIYAEKVTFFSEVFVISDRKM